MDQGIKELAAKPEVHPWNPQDKRRIDSGRLLSDL